MDYREFMEKLDERLEGIVDMKAIDALRKELMAEFETRDEWLKEVQKDANKLRSPLGPGAVTEADRHAIGAWFRSRLLRRSDPMEARRLEGQAYAALGMTKAALQEDTDDEGGYLVPAPIMDRFFALAAKISVIRPLSMILPMTSKTLDLPTIANSPTASIVAEEGTIPDGGPASPFGSGSLTAKKISSMFTISEEVIQDAAIDIVGEYILLRTAETIAGMEDAQGLEGDGSGANFTGLFAASGVGAVAVGGALTNLDDFIDALFGTLPFAALEDPSNAIAMHPKVWRDIQKLKIVEYSGGTNGSYRNDPMTAQPRSLHGVPVKLSDQILTNRGGGSDETTVYMGSFRRGMVIGDRQRLELKIDPYTLMDTAQLRVRVLERVAILVAVPEAFVKLTAIQV